MGPMIISIAFRGAGTAVKPLSGITSVKCSTRGGVRLISGYMGTRCCSTNASAWGVNYSIPPNRKKRMISRNAAPRGVASVTGSRRNPDDGREKRS